MAGVVDPPEYGSFDQVTLWTLRLRVARVR
jgi:hypothetical protein